MIICLMAPSAAGKSTLAKHLQARWSERFARVPVDWFFVPRRPAESVDDYLARPLAYDWPAVDRALAAHGPDRSTPDCDFATFTRRSEIGGLPIADAPILLLDGMRPHPRCDIVVTLQLDPATQQRRLVERDARWGTTVAARRAHLDATYRLGCRELARSFDLRLDAEDPIEENARRVVDLLGAREERAADDVCGDEEQ